MTRLEHVIARNLIELRETRHLTQSDLAAKMRGAGFNWQTNRVTQIETLRRPVSLLEVIGLSRVFAEPVGRLLAGDDVVDLPDGSTLHLERVRQILAGKTDGTWNHITPENAERWRASRDDFRKLAKSLEVDPDNLERIAEGAFGRPLHDEREARLGDVSDLSPRSAQTKRGHVTRALIAELREWMDAHPDEVTKK